MERKKMSFAEFYDKCDKLYCKYAPHFFLQGCEIIANFDGNEIDNGCWYCIVKIRDNVHTILAYDHTDETDLPFIISCDWSQQTGVVGKFGYLSECEEFSSLEEAFYFMIQEPDMYHIRYEEDMVHICEKGKYDVVLDGLSGFGFLDSIKVVNTDDFYKGKTIEILQPKSYGRTILFKTTK